LQNTKLYKLFIIRANIEDALKLTKYLEKDILKIFGFGVVYLSGITSAVFTGLYSGISSNIMSTAILNMNANKINSEFEKKIYENFNNLSAEVSISSTLGPLFYEVIKILGIILIIRLVIEYTKKSDIRYATLLDLVNLTIEVKKVGLKGISDGSNIENQEEKKINEINKKKYNEKNKNKEKIIKYKLKITSVKNDK
jgi:hypothetical protein